ncbi:MAG: 6-bladed beta-propeller, partial [Actinomycetes bacterium]
GSVGMAKPLDGAKITWKPGSLNYPTGIAVDSKGEVYVADFFNDSISVFSEKGEFLRRFPDPYKPTGRGGSGAGGGGIAVTAVAVSGDKVYATDAYQVVVFSAQGELLNQFGRPGPGPDGLDHPNGIAVDKQGRIYVSDSNQSRVTAFSPEGTVLWTLGTPIKSLTEESNNPFILPRGLTVLGDGSLLVADPLAHALVRLSSEGKVLANYGDRGEAPGQLNFPNAVAARDSLILVTDKENDRVQVVRLVGP